MVYLLQLPHGSGLRLPYGRIFVGGKGAFLEDGGNLCTGADCPVSGMVPVYPLFAEARKITFSQVSEFQYIREEPFLAGK